MGVRYDRTNLWSQQQSSLARSFGFVRSLYAQLLYFTETAEAAIESFKRAAKQARTFAPMIHTDRSAAYTSKDFNNYLTSNNSKHSLSAPGIPADNAVIEHYWGDFKYIWMAHHSHPQTLAELKDLVKQGVEYFNTVEISSKRNNLTAEDFCNEAV